MERVEAGTDDDRVWVAETRERRKERRRAFAALQEPEVVAEREERVERLRARRRQIVDRAEKALPDATPLAHFDGT